MIWVVENLFWGSKSRALVELAASTAPLRAAPELLPLSTEASAATAAFLGLGGLPLPAPWPAARRKNNGARHRRVLLEERSSPLYIFVAAF